MDIALDAMDSALDTMDSAIKPFIDTGDPCRVWSTTVCAVLLLWAWMSLQVAESTNSITQSFCLWFDKKDSDF